MTERDGFWEPEEAFGSGRGFRGGLPGDLKADVVVCKDEEGGGGGCYKTVQEAVDAAPEKVDGEEGRFVIHIKEGVYEERVRVPLKKRNVVFLGDGMGKTVITGSASVGLQPGMTTYNSATVGGFSFVLVELFIFWFVLFVRRSPVSKWCLILSLLRSSFVLFKVLVFY